MSISDDKYAAMALRNIIKSSVNYALRETKEKFIERLNKKMSEIERVSLMACNEIKEKASCFINKYEDVLSQITATQQGMHSLYLRMVDVEAEMLRLKSLIDLQQLADSLKEKIK